jgi:hypothetical protein
MKKIHHRDTETQRKNIGWWSFIHVSSSVPQCLCGERSRGSALFLVLGVVAAAALMAASVLVTGDSTATTSDRHAERLHLRAAAWSGLQSLMADLAAQREDLLLGKDPRLELDLLLSDESAPDRVVVRLVPIPPDDKTPADPRAEPILTLPESARLDLNRATPEMFAALGLAEPAAAEIFARRTARPFASVEELATLASPIAPALTNLLTTLAYDPNLQTGLASPDTPHEPRVTIAQGWSEAFRQELPDQLAPTAAAIQRVLEQSPAPASDADLLTALSTQGLPRDLLPAAFDFLTTSDDLYVPGRVDLLRAPEPVLAALPGLNAERAAALVAARAQLSDDERRSRVWPLTRDLVPPEDFAKTLPWLATRSTQWRVRVQASIDARAADAPRVLRSAVYEAVLDAAGETPRLAYLREVTLLPLAQIMQTRVGTLARALAERTPPVLPSASADTPPPPATDQGRNPREDSAPSSPDVDNPSTGDAPGTTNNQGADSGADSGAGGTLVDRRRGRWNAGRTP